MNSVRIFFDNYSKGYLYSNVSNIEMNFLGVFFISDIHCSNIDRIKNWIMTSEKGAYFSGNTTGIEIVEEDVILSDLYPEEGYTSEIKISKIQLINLLNEWQEKVCNAWPKELCIIHDNDEFYIKVTQP